VFIILFQHKFNPDSTSQLLSDFLSENDVGDQREYLEDVVLGYLRRAVEIDKKIDDYAEKWDMERLSSVSLAVLRLAIYELFYRSDIPVKVTNNEATNLASKYDGEESANFVNGVLGKIQKEIESLDVDA
jgi:N utilization substance protein B